MEEADALYLSIECLDFKDLPVISGPDVVYWIKNESLGLLSISGLRSRAGVSSKISTGNIFSLIKISSLSYGGKKLFLIA